MSADLTTYSGLIKGTRGNYGWSARFDISESGYLGISQFEGDAVKDRVLLSPAQVKELLAFCGRKAK